jgi:hypothetical protein
MLNVLKASLVINRRWVRTSWDFYTSLAMSSLAKETGQTLVSGYVNRDWVEVSTTL